VTLYRLDRSLTLHQAAVRIFGMNWCVRASLSHTNSSPFKQCPSDFMGERTHRRLAKGQRIIGSHPAAHQVPKEAGSNSVVDCLYIKLLKSLNVVLHVLERFGGGVDGCVHPLYSRLTVGKKYGGEIDNSCAEASLSQRQARDASHRPGSKVCGKGVHRVIKRARD
jgi:hypothetical protein